MKMMACGGGSCRGGGVDFAPLCTSPKQTTFCITLNKAQTEKCRSKTKSVKTKVCKVCM